METLLLLALLLVLPVLLMVLALRGPYSRTLGWAVSDLLGCFLLVVLIIGLVTAL